MLSLQMIREAISNHTGNALPEEPPLPPARAFGPVRLTGRVSLMDSLPVLSPGDGIPAFKPAAMESYGQPCASFLPFATIALMNLDRRNAEIDRDLRNMCDLREWSVRLCAVLCVCFSIRKIFWTVSAGTV